MDIAKRYFGEIWKTEHKTGFRKVLGRVLQFWTEFRNEHIVIKEYKGVFLSQYIRLLEWSQQDLRSEYYRVKKILLFGSMRKHWCGFKEYEKGLGERFLRSDYLK